MAIKKSQLYSSLWQSCNELRGSMDASQYKDYVLTLLFMKYVSDKYAHRSDASIVVPAGGGFADMAQLQGDKDIGDKINKIISRFAEANDLQGVIDKEADFNDETKLGRGKEMQDRLSKLVAIFDGFDFSSQQAGGDDLLGDAYEYLMRHFATESGKSKGQFYTPAEVSRILAQVVGIGPETSQDQTIYDPTCGSGSLLLKAADEAPRGMSIYGQEKDNTTWALARMNMILHDHPTADLRVGNTLAQPAFEDEAGDLKRFDFAVSNPPFSDKAWSNGLQSDNDVYNRFHYGVPPDKNGDYAYLSHLIASLKNHGKGAIILPHGVLFRGNKEADIRQKLVGQGFIKGVIGLPANLFYGTGIPACILVIDKENAAARKGVFMIDASRGFKKEGNKNRLRVQDIHRIVDTFTRAIELPRYSRMVGLAEVSKNDYNLNIPRYIDSREPEDLHDLRAHLQGGIPNVDIEALGEYWSVFPSLRKNLFQTRGAKGDKVNPSKAQGSGDAVNDDKARDDGADDSKGYSHARHAPEKVKSVVLESNEFKHYQQQIKFVFKTWCVQQLSSLKHLQARGEKNKNLRAYNNRQQGVSSVRSSTLLTDHGSVNVLLKDLSESLLKAFSSSPNFNSEKQNGAESVEAVSPAAVPSTVVSSVAICGTGIDKKQGKLVSNLLNPYNVYQRFMDYVDDTMKDDVDMVVSESWLAAVQPRLLVASKSNKNKETPDLVLGSKKYKMDVLPPQLVVAHYFKPEQAELDKLQAKADTIERQLDEFVELHAGEGTLLEGVADDKGKLSKKVINELWKNFKSKHPKADADADAGSGASVGTDTNADAGAAACAGVGEDRQILERCRELLDVEAAMRKNIKSSEADLNKKVFDKYSKLSEDEVKELVVDHKWRVDIGKTIDVEVQQLAQLLASRVRLLEERYAVPLPSLDAQLKGFDAKVQGHLKDMGLAW